MSGAVYTPALLRLAAQGALVAALSPADAEADLRSRLCGSRVRVTLRLDRRTADGRATIVGYGHDVSACVFGQASAALVACGTIGADLAGLREARDALSAWLRGERSDPGNWPGLEALIAARAHPARHASILLPFDAVIRALENF